MANRLTVHADGRDCRAVGMRPQLRDAFGVMSRQLRGGQRLAVNFVGAAGLQRHQFGAQIVAERHVGRGNRVDGSGIVSKRRQHAVDAVEAGAGHQAYV